MFILIAYTEIPFNHDSACYYILIKRVIYNEYFIILLKYETLTMNVVYNKNTSNTEM